MHFRKILTFLVSFLTVAYLIGLFHNISYLVKDNTHRDKLYNFQSEGEYGEYSSLIVGDDITVLDSRIAQRGMFLISTSILELFVLLLYILFVGDTDEKTRYYYGT